jgi:hypothetical protein
MNKQGVPNLQQRRQESVAHLNKPEPKLKYLKDLFFAKGSEQITSHSCNNLHAWLLILYFVAGR